MAEVESFTLDHNIVKAPYIRLINQTKGPQGDIITNFDVRLAQPNETSINTSALHTLEHLFADLLRDELDGIIDVSPFGCRTGFHLLMWGTPSATEVAKVFKKVLTKIVNEIRWEDVQGVSKVACGNYKDHSLFSAKEWAKLVLEAGISDDAFVRNVI